MGYCISLQESTIVIKKENAEKVIETLRDLAKEKLGDGKRLMWINLYSLVDSESIEDTFDQLRYQLKTNDDGDYEIDYLSGEKLGDDYELFQAIAPYIEDGYIEVSGEDNCIWRWVFESGECKEVYPTVTWE